MNPEEYLLPVEKDQLRAFNENVVLKNALRKVFLEPLYQHGVMTQGEVDPTRNFALVPAFHMLTQKREMWDVEKLGMITMANAMAIQFVEQGFGEVEKFGTAPDVKKEKKVNNAM